MHIGLTGGIGSGKSTVAAVFEHLGVPVYYSDNQAKKLMTESDELRASITAAFGSEAYLPDGNLNKDYLRHIVFADEAGRLQMNGLVHPAVGKDFLSWTQRQQTNMTIFESALLFQSPTRVHMHRIVAVTAPEEIRIARVMLRDKITRASAIQRLNSQLTQSEISAQADEIIDNSGNTLIIPQILTLITHYNNGKV